ncbi:hypothetical protein FD755_014177 [Muntiacus reevesi]|uniref:Cytoplasmic dynein 1 intermediate chain 2 n=1 Tax=Muntiacus reevesi TaxID=9886 RepID=A0A5N3XJ30_MUNRE|nr:hypothetical protein FD755_014177 [Muntiacus reevesi]
MSYKRELKAELERKKQRLAQIREEKRKEEERKRKLIRRRKQREAEGLLQSMGLTAESPIVPPPMSPPSKFVSTPSEAGSQDSGDGAVGSRRGPIKLGMAKITQVDFPPRETVTYTKETQTPVMAQPKEDEEEKMIKAPPHELTEEEKQQILHSEEFLSFFDHSTRIVERALSEQINIFFDYSGRDLEDKGGEIQAGAKLSLNQQFFDERWSKHWVVSCLDWSSQYPELLVASYNNNEDAPHEPDSMALAWNMKYKKTTPEYVFHCQSAVMSATFAKFHPNLVVSGTYSGQIVLWDNHTHTHPVYCVNVGTQNAHNLISISTDEKICSWMVHKQSKAVAVTSMSFPVGDVNNFVVGGEEGSVYTVCRHGRTSGSITGIHCHSAVGAVDFSHLFVTSSFDWTVKLWTTKNNKPLYSFKDNSDYVSDVMWSPTHPALFACVDGMGRLDLWNLNNGKEVPTASISVEGNPALNRVRWTHSGREIAVGDSEGQIVIYDVREIAVPRNDEWAQFG